MQGRAKQPVEYKRNDKTNLENSETVLKRKNGGVS